MKRLTITLLFGLGIILGVIATGNCGGCDFYADFVKPIPAITSNAVLAEFVRSDENPCLPEGAKLQYIVYPSPSGARYFQYDKYGRISKIMTQINHQKIGWIPETLFVYLTDDKDSVISKVNYYTYYDYPVGIQKTHSNYYWYKTTNGRPQLVAMTDVYPWKKSITKYSYDANGSLVKIKGPDVVTIYNYIANNPLFFIKSTGKAGETFCPGTALIQRDDNNHVLSVHKFSDCPMPDNLQDLGSAEYVYDSNGKLVKDSNDTIVVRDSSGIPTRITTAKGDTIQKFIYAK
jgi:hypothetical protein